MALTSKPFGNIVTYSRASGATRVNAAGLIVGVDFSATSNTIGTGSKTFTLAATAGVNRDWPASSAIRAVDQVGGGTMTGTVTSYNATTQELVINVTSITGSGTSTNWRIGSLEFRRDFDPVTLAPRGGLVEGQATNVFLPSSTVGGVLGGTQTNNVGVNLFGSATFSRFDESNQNTTHGISNGNGVYSVIAGQTYTYTEVIRPINKTRFGIATGVFGGGVNVFASFNTQTLTVIGSSTAGGVVFVGARVTPFADGLFALSVSFIPPQSNGYAREINGHPEGSATHLVEPAYVGVPGQGFEYGYAQVETSPVLTSFMPTTTTPVTRAADLLNIDGTRFSQAYNQSQGTLYVEMTPTAAAVQAVAASINDGTLNNAIRVGQKQSGTLSSIRAIASDGVTDVMALNNATNNTVRSNGIDYAEVSDGGGAVKLGVASAAVGALLNVGGSENIRNSADSGLTYNERTIGGTFFGAHFGIGRFVIAGSTATINGATVGSVIVSTDGLTFRRVNIPGLTQQLNEVTSNGTNQYVAVGGGGVIYTSPDAETWTAQTSGTVSVFNAVHWFGGRYVAVSNTSGASIYSDNGTSWMAVTGLSAVMQDVAHNGTNLWVAVGNTGAIYSSADGITWTSRTSGVTKNLRGVHFADGLWVAVGATGTVVTSPDGVTWTDRTATSGTTQTLNKVGFFGGKFYYGGNSGTIRENSAADIVAGVTWTSRGNTTVFNGNVNGIAASGTRLFFAGSDASISTTEDGVTITSRTGNGVQLNGAAFGNGTYVVVGNAMNGSGLIATVDQTTFAYTRRVSNTTQSLNCAIANASRLIVGGNASVVRYADDAGINWQSVTIGGTAFNVLALAANGSTLLAIGSGGRYSISTDNGATWGASALNGVTTQNLTSVHFANGLFVAVGNAGTIITSPNGTTWTLRTSGVTSALYAVRWNTRDQCFYAAGDSGVILRSADGITWENIANDAIGAVINGGSIQSNPALPNLTPNAINKVAMRIKANDFAVSVNGADAVTDTTGSLPVTTQLSLGMSGTGANPFNGHIRKIQYFPVTKTNAELKGLTT